MACGFHGGGFGTYGTQWQPYTGADNFDASREYTPVATKTDKRAKPIFSKVASRASDIAKLRIKVKARKKAAADKKLAQVKTD